jgi:hypothetical protein
LSLSPGQVDYVLLSRTPRPPQQRDVRLAWLNLNPIAVGSGRINRSRLYREQEYSRITAESYCLAKPMSDLTSVRSPFFVRASGGRAFQSNGLRPSAPRRRRQAMRKPARGTPSGYKPSLVFRQILRRAVTRSRRACRSARGLAPSRRTARSSPHGTGVRR